jgi:hypothetical protein
MSDDLTKLMNGDPATFSSGYAGKGEESVYDRTGFPPVKIAPSSPMSDDLIKRLKARIEELELELYEMNELYGSVKDGLEDKLAKAVEVMKALQKDMLERSRAGMDTIHGNKYRIVNAGRTAWIEFCATLAELEGK